MRVADLRSELRERNLTVTGRKQELIRRLLAADELPPPPKAFTARRRHLGLLSSMDPATMTLGDARKLLTLPRTVGNHTELGGPITASIGRYGPFLSHNGTFASLKDEELLFDIGVEEASALIDVKTAAKRKRDRLRKERQAVASRRAAPSSSPTRRGTRSKVSAGNHATNA